MRVGIYARISKRFRFFFKVAYMGLRNASSAVPHRLSAVYHLAHKPNQDLMFDMRGRSHYL